MMPVPCKSLNATQQKLKEEHPELTRKDGSFDFNRARARYYEPELINKIIEYRESGLSPQQSFKKARLDRQSFRLWKNKLADEDCPPSIKYLFAHLILDPKDERYIPENMCPLPLYYNSDIVDAILKYKQAGLSDQAAVKGAGVYYLTYMNWRKKIKTDPECPKKLKDLFRDMAKAESKVMADVVSIVVTEAVENKNWKAAVDLMPRLWRNEYGACAQPEEPELLAPTFNLDELSQEEQETFIRLSKKCRLEDKDSQTDSKVKLLISLPDNGR